MKKIKITESQYNRLLKELDNNITNIPNKRIPNIKALTPEIGDPHSRITDINLLEPKINEPLTQEEIQKKIDFLESFFRDMIDFQEFAANQIDNALMELSKGEIGIPEVQKKLALLTARKGRTSFYTAKRGLSAS